MTRVLVPVDDEEHARRACDLASELFPAGALTLLHVVSPPNAGYSSETPVPSVSESWYEDREAEAEALFDRLERHLADREDGGPPTVERHVTVDQPARGIAASIEDEAVDHVVMGSHSRQGVSRLLLGSVAETVARQSPVPVTLV